MAEEVVERRLVTTTDTTRITANAEWFKDCFDLASAIILDEVQFDIKEDGLYMKQMDESRVARTDMFLPKTSFRELKRGKEVNTLRFDIGDINAILGKTLKGDIITFYIGEQGGLLVEIKGKRINNYKLPLLEAEVLETRDPKVMFGTRVKTNIDGLVNIVDRAKALLASGGKKREAWAATFTLTSNPMGISLRFASDDGMKSGEAQLTTGWDIICFEGSTEQEVVISQVYMEKVIKALAAITNIVQIEMSTFVPIHIIAELPFKGSLAFWIAPRIPEKETKKVKAKAEVKSE